MSLYYVIFLSFASGMLGGLGVYLGIHFVHLRFQLGLEYRLTDLEGRVSREQKIRAVGVHNDKKKSDRELLERIQEEASQQKPTLTLESWKTAGFRRK